MDRENVQLIRTFYGLVKLADLFIDNHSLQ
jgi:hypothetical protein